MEESESSGFVSFGVFEADLRSRELRRNGHKVRLQQQPFEVLAILLEHAGEVVTREELREKLWSADTFVDFDHGLNAAVRRLRGALDDSAENPRFIETLARRGYRFIAPVQKPAVAKTREEPRTVATSHDAVAAGHHSSASELGAPIWHRFRTWLATAVIAIFLIGGVAAGWRAGHRSAASVRPVESRMTANPENDPIWGAALSPDGKYLAFSSHAGVFLRMVATGETHTIALADDLRTGPLSWYPDGSHLLAVRGGWKTEKPSLWSISVFGGSPQQLVENAGSGTVSPDAAQLAFIRGDYAHEEVWLADANGEHARRVLGEPGDNFDSLTWSADGTRIAFVRQVVLFAWQEGEISLGVLDVATGKTGYLLSSARLGGAVAWTPDGKLIYSLAEEPPNQDDTNLWAVKLDASGTHESGPAWRLTSGPDWKAVITVSNDGKRMSFLRRSYAPIISVADLEDGGSRLGSPRRLSLDERRNLPYTWTPDGTSLIFTSDRDGVFQLFRQGVDQPAPDLLAGAKKQIRIARLSGDLTQILYTVEPLPTDPDHRVQLMRIPVAGGRSEQVLAEPGINNFQCARGPGAICIFSEMSTNHLDFFTFDPMTGKEATLTQIEDPEWYLYNWTLSPDGATIALAKKRRSQGGGTIRLFPLDGRRERTLTVAGWPSITSIDWTADGRGLWASAISDEGKHGLLRVDLHGKLSLMLEAVDRELGWAIPSLDGKRVAIWEATANSNAWLLEGF
jgi:Tol biopolymer transport system component/DNA-binding winged helix-turn-helix (wHTH) protein